MRRRRCAVAICALLRPWQAAALAASAAPTAAARTGPPRSPGPAPPVGGREREDGAGEGRRRLAAAAAGAVAVAEAFGQLRLAVATAPPPALGRLQTSLTAEEAALLAGRDATSRQLRRRFRACQRRGSALLVESAGVDGVNGDRQDAGGGRRGDDAASPRPLETSLALELEVLARDLRAHLELVRERLALPADAAGRRWPGAWLGSEGVGAPSARPPAVSPPPPAPRPLPARRAARAAPAAPAPGPVLGTARGGAADACSAQGIAAAAERFDAALRGFRGPVLRQMLPPERESLQRTVHSMGAQRHALLNALAGGQVAQRKSSVEDCQRYHAGVRQLEADLASYRNDDGAAPVRTSRGQDRRARVPAGAW